MIFSQALWSANIVRLYQRYLGLCHPLYRAIVSYFWLFLPFSFLSWVYDYLLMLTMDDGSLTLCLQGYKASFFWDSHSFVGLCWLLMASEFGF